MNTGTEGNVAIELVQRITIGGKPLDKCTPAEVGKELAALVSRVGQLRDESRERLGAFKDACTIIEELYYEEFDEDVYADEGDEDDNA